MLGYHLPDHFIYFVYVEKLLIFIEYYVSIHYVNLISYVVLQYTVLQFF